MINSRLTILFPILCILSSCHSYNNEEVIVLQETKSPKAFLDIVESISMIPLTDDSEHLMGSSIQLFADEGGFTLVDKFNSIINKYSRDGHFLTTVGRRGNGPGEYLNISNVQLTQEKILVFSMPGIVSEYDKNGVFIKNRKFESLGDQSILTEGGILTYYGYKQYPNYRMAFIDDSGKEHHYFDTENRVIHFMSPTPVFCVDMDNVYVIDSYSDIIYRFSNGQCEPYLHFEFGKYAIPDDFYKFSDVYEGMTYLLSREFAVINQIIKNNKYTIVQVSLQNQDTVKKEYCLLYEGTSNWFTLNTASPLDLSGCFLDNKLYCLINLEQVESISNAFASKITGEFTISSPKDNESSYAIAEITLK